MKNPPAPTGKSFCLLKFATRIGLLIVLVTLIAVPFFSPSSASVLDKPFQNGLTAMVQNLNSAETPALSPLTNWNVRQLLGFRSLSAVNPLLLTPQAPPVETLSVYQGDCATPDNSFALGETVCAKLTGAPAFRRRLAIINPDGYIVSQVTVTNDPETLVFTLPTSTTSDFGENTVDNRGKWRAASIETADATTRLVAAFTVSDPQVPVADVSISKSVTNDSQVAAGNLLSFSVFIYNNGPDAAASVQMTDIVPNNTTFFSAIQDSGPTFTCTNPTPGATGTTSCFLSSMAADSIARFNLTYRVDSGATPGTLILNNARVTTTTLERSSSDNNAEASTTVATVGGGGGGETCSVSCPDDINQQANTTDGGGNPGAIIHFSSPSGNEECGLVTADHCNDCFFPVGTTVVTATATTGESCSFSVIVTAATGGVPTISCPPNKTATADSSCQAAVALGTPTTTGANVTVTAVRSDDRDISDPFRAGTTVVTWTASNASGSASCEQTVIVNDVSAPTIDAPPSQTASADENCEARVPDFSATANAQDNCAVDVGQDPAAGTLVGPGNHTVTLTATDGAGNTATSSTTFSVSDTTAPVISCPADIVQAIDAGTCTATVDPGTATAVENCGTATITGVRSDNQPLNAPYPKGTTTITWTATDSANNSSSCMQTVTVNDRENPTVAAPADSSASADASCQAAVPDYAANSTASDNCANPTVTQSPAAGTMVGPGPHTVTVTATDSSGNTSSDSVVFTVNDTTTPTVTAPADSSASADASCQAPVPNYAAGSTAADNCDSSVTVTQSPAAGTMVGSGPHTVTVTATDDSGNSGSDTVVFTVNDTTAPVISCPANIVVYLPLNSTATSMAVSYPAVTATDNCSTPTITSSPASGSVFPVGTTTVNATATDVAGNSSSCSFTVTVLYNFTGFFSPVGNLPTLNSVNAGRAIPVKFNLSGDKGLAIFASDSPYTVALNCVSGDLGVEVTETYTAGGSSLSFGGGDYHYTWKTESSWAGTCRQLVVKLNDGSEHRANFKFR